jgi:plasmid segregation protein ParM
MNIGIDIGYSSVKTVAGPDRLSAFPSVVGTPDRARFAVNGADGHIIVDLPGEGSYLVGEGAIVQSRFTDRREDRGWIASNAYQRLMLAGFTNVTAAAWCELVVVTGLPVAFYSADKDALRDRFLGHHRVAREGRRAQTFLVTECRVIPQPFGALLAEALNDQGKIVNQDLAIGAVGVIDIGGKTTNLLSVNRLAEIGRETASINVGVWDVARAVREYLVDHCSGLELRDHQVIDAIVKRHVKYFGTAVDLANVIDATLEPMADQVIAQATQLWNGAAGLEAILVAGGGALLLGPYLARSFPHVRTVDNPVFANALGYWRFAVRLGAQAGARRVG